jgi:hypothetical protein
MATLSLKGRILTLEDWNGTSSVDLSAVKGDDGCRGPQGRAGIILDSYGNVVTEGYATEEYVEEYVTNALGDVVLDNYCTKDEVIELIKENSLASAEGVGF